MFVLEFDSFNEDRDPDEGDDFPRIRVQADTEQEAVDIWTILYNAYLLSGGRAKSVLTNVNKGVMYTTYICKIETFADLQSYMQGVHCVNLKLTQY